MAFKIGELFVDVSVRGMLGVHRSLDVLRGSLSRIHGGLVRTASAISNSFLPLAGGLSAAGVAGGFVALVKNAADLESGFSSVQRTSGLTGVEFDRLKTRIREMSRELKGVSVHELQQIATVAGQLGLSGTEIESFIPTVAKLSKVADDLPAEQAANALAQIKNLFKLPVTELERVATTITKVAGTTVATEGEIVNLTNRMAGAAALAGMTVQETIAIAGALRDAGANLEVGGTAMTQLFLKMLESAQEGSDELRDFANAAGMAEKAWSDLVQRSPTEAFVQLLDNLSRLDKVAAVQALGGLGLEGARLRGTALQLRSTIDNLRTALADANQEFENGSDLQNKFAVRSATVNAELTGMWNRFRLVAEEAGGALLPVIRDLIQDFNAFIESMRGGLNDGSIQGAFAQLIQFAKDYGAALSENIAIVRRLIDALLDMAGIGAPGMKAMGQEDVAARRADQLQKLHRDMEAEQDPEKQKRILNEIVKREQERIKLLRHAAEVNAEPLRDRLAREEARLAGFVPNADAEVRRRQEQRVAEARRMVEAELKTVEIAEREANKRIAEAEAHLRQEKQAVQKDAAAAPLPGKFDPNVAARRKAEEKRAEEQAKRMVPLLFGGEVPLKFLDDAASKIKQFTQDAAGAVFDQLWARRRQEFEGPRITVGGDAADAWRRLQEATVQKDVKLEDIMKQQLAKQETMAQAMQIVANWTRQNGEMLKFAN